MIGAVAGWMVAYGGSPGPLLVTLVEDRNLFRLIVADKGVGRAATRKGFGSRLLAGLVRQLSGTLDYEDNQPGTRAVLTGTIEAL